MDLIDIHTHILPGLDNGAQDLKQALAMAEAAVKDGINLMVATPHVIKGVCDNSKADILQHVRNLNQCLEYARVKLPILPGAEYHLEPSLPRRLRAGELLTINDTGRYLLVELPATPELEFVDQLLHSLQEEGVSPIIAHPERNLGLAKNPAILEAWTNDGMLAQVNSASLTGLFGRRVKKTAWKFLQTGVAQMIASDSHAASGRAPVLYPAFQEIERRWGVGYARTLTSINPNLIISGLPLEITIPPTPERPWTKYFKS